MRISATKYAYISAKVRGMKTKLLDRNDYQTLLQSDDLEDVYTFLEGTPYGAELRKISTGKVEALTMEFAIVQNLFETYRKIKEKSPKDIASLIDRITMKFEIENVKATLRSINAGLNPDEALRYVLPVLGGFSREIYRNILNNATSVEDLIKLFRDTEYGPILERSFGDFEQKGTIMPIETSLDKYAYEKMWMTINKLDRRDRRIAKDLVGTEIDLINIRTILRCRTLGLSAEESKNYIISPAHMLTDKILEKGLNAPSINEAVTVFLIQPYQKMLETALKQYNLSKSLTEVEIETGGFLVRANKRIMRKNPSPFHIGVILSFFNLKWFEVRNLKALIYGKEEKLPVVLIEKALIY